MIIDQVYEHLFQIVPTFSKVFSKVSKGKMDFSYVLDTRDLAGSLASKILSATQNACRID